MQAYKWLWPYVKKYGVFMAFGFVFSLASSVLGLIKPYVSGRIVDEVFQRGHFDALRGLLVFMVSVVFAETVLAYLQRRAFEAASQNALVDLRRDIYRRVQSQTYAFFDNNRVGDVMSRLTGDLDAIRHFIAFVSFGLFENAVFFVAAAILIFSINWQLSLLLLSVTPVIGVCAYRQSSKIKPTFWRIREDFAKLNTVCQENISGNKVVKAFSKQDYEIEKFLAQNNEYYNANIDSAAVWVKYLPVLDFCAGLLFFILILAGGFMVMWGRLEIWQLVTVNGYLWMLTVPLREMGWRLNDTQRFNASLDKIFMLMRERITIYAPEGALCPQTLRGEVEFKNVTFGYGASEAAPCLENISFKASPGRVIGIVGPTACGKTTLVNLIGRFYDVKSGAVLVDGTNVREYDLFALRKHISYATQDVFLFSDTVEGNIAYGRPEIPFEGVVSAAVDAEAHGFIENLPDGYDTIIGERGVGLSGGQKQRLALSRALAANPAVLILDDTTSAVDMETESRIQKSLSEKYAAQTKFIIAHRLSSVMDADLILVLNGGRIAERGTHNELIALKGYYYSLFISQYGEYEAALSGGGPPEARA